MYVVGTHFEPLLFAHMKYDSRRRVQPNIRPLAPLDGCACTFKEWVYGGQKVQKKKKKKKNELAQFNLPKHHGLFIDSGFCLRSPGLYTASSGPLPRVSTI